FLFRCRLSSCLSLFPSTRLFRSRWVVVVLQTRLSCGPHLRRLFDCGVGAAHLAPVRDMAVLGDSVAALGRGHRCAEHHGSEHARDRKSTRLNSSHEWISYAVCCL